jgi:hypothetical protein
VILSGEVIKPLPLGAVRGGDENGVMGRSFKNESGACFHPSRGSVAARIHMRSRFGTLQAVNGRLLRLSRIGRKIVWEHVVEAKEPLIGKDKTVVRDALPETRWPREQHVIERFAPLERRFHKHIQVFLDLLLADKLVEGLWAQELFDVVVRAVGLGLEGVGARCAHGRGGGDKGVKKRGLPDGCWEERVSCVPIVFGGVWDTEGTGGTPVVNFCRSSQ